MWGGFFLIYAALLAIVSPESPDTQPLMLTAAGISGLVGVYLYVRTHEEPKEPPDDGHRPRTWRD